MGDVPPTSRNMSLHTIITFAILPYLTLPGYIFSTFPEAESFREEPILEGKGGNGLMHPDTMSIGMLSKGSSGLEEKRKSVILKVRVQLRRRTVY